MRAKQTIKVLASWHKWAGSMAMICLLAASIPLLSAGCIWEFLTETGAEAEAEPGAEIRQETETETGSGTETETEAETGTEVETGAGTEPETELETETETGTETGTETEPGVETVTATGVDVAGLERFASQEAFKSYLADRVEEEGMRYWWGAESEMYDGVMLGGPMATEAAPAAPASDSAEQGGGDDFSTTNIQEEGVGESDVIKNDGTYLYILVNQELRIVQAVPADDMILVSTTELPDRASEIYLKGDIVIAVGSGYNYDSHGDLTAVMIVDVTDRASPALTTTIEADGSMVTSRLIGSKLHLVLSVWPDLPQESGSGPILESDVNALIPDITVTPAPGETMTRDLVEWQGLYHPVEPDGYFVTAVVTLDVDEPDEPWHSVGVMTNTGTVYVSPTALYLTDTEYDDTGEYREATDIYRLDLEDEGAVPVGKGSIPGRLLNRFSLGEYQGYLRAATTVGHVHRSGDNDAKNNVYVLHPEDGELAIVGQVEEIAPGERIYSARFIGERGFLVTFKKVDPLFTMDLSDPTSPRVVGELKVPGYSDYIHPLGSDHLLTIGKDAIDVGEFAWYQGVQLSVFDVTDFAEPKRLDVEVVGERGTDSEALRNPHAFNFFPPLETLAVPMRIAEDAGEEPWIPGTETFRGLCLFHVSTEDGIEPLGRIATEGYGWTRGVFIGDYVYMVTPSGVQAMPLDDPTGSVHRLSLE